MSYLQSSGICLVAYCPGFAQSSGWVLPVPTIPSPVVPVRPAVPLEKLSEHSTHANVSILEEMPLQRTLQRSKKVHNQTSSIEDADNVLPETVPDSTLAQTRTTRKCPSVFAGKKRYLGILLVIVVLVTVAISLLYIESECEPENKSKVNEDIEANVLLRGAKFDELLDTGS
jgi:hypothetical protein